MATRARTRSTANLNAEKSTSNTPDKATRSRTSRTKDGEVGNDMDVEKENKGNPGRGKAKVQPKVKAKSKTKDESYCLCRQPDDGSPMVHCSQCKEWYHFRCVNLDQNDADDIRVYVCPPCIEKTGQRTVSECLWSLSCSLLRNLLFTSYNM
ncbi:hypothetical protein SERLA73DRAFT_184942 [Serpula lacrymans var. lacrymans S7.3]|uniref:PHD-type domain-containing protein n=1 Tax=Serpula lacrymans var. lacrymans (strain S7.3) TaxID=936435 RepID=F8Q3S6_SERL3|nr:hypothetical protein SERLA73DRAFT_184942 [Serpula lacrymans var. lacrymans S7.3]